MKKLLLLFVMMLTATIAAWADVEVEVDGLRFSVSTGSIPVTAKVIAPAEGVYTGEITIPSSINYNGEDVTVDFINSNAFENATITKVTIPNTVYFIGARAFYHCESLTEITLPEGLREISTSVFAGCPFTSLTIPGTLTIIGSYGLEGLSSLQKLTFAYSEEKLSMDWSVFNGTNNITELVIDRDYSFGNNTSICTNTVKKVTFGEHITKVPENACYKMSLDELNISANVTAIGESAFMQCTLPEGYNFPFAQIKEIEAGGFYLCKNLPANIDLTGVEKIEENAFSNTDVQTVKLGNSLTSLGESAFYSCSKLTAINIPGSINSFNKNCFYDCNALTDVTFDYGSTALTLEDGTFSYATNLTIDRTIDSGTNPISTKVTKVALGSHMNTSSALSSLNLSQCPELTEIELLEGYKELPRDAFKDLATVTTVKLPEGLEIIGLHAFQGTSLTSLTIPGTVKYVRGQALPTSLTSLTLSAGEETLTFDQMALGQWASDVNVTDLNIDRNYTNYGGKPLSEKVKRVTFGNHVTAIYQGAFQDCTLEQAITFPSSLKEIGDNAFRNCKVSAITLNEGLETIESRTFYQCTATFNGIPTTLKSIGQSAFSGCTGLTGDLVIPAGVTELGMSTFYGTGITSVTIPGTVTKINQSDFGNCANLTTVTLLSGEAPLTIGKRCFYSSNNITDVTIDRDFTYYNDLEKNRSPFNTAIERVTFGSNVTRVGDRALASCMSLTDVVLPDNITTIGIEAFKWAKPSSLTLSKNLTTVEDYGFYAMVGPASFTLPISLNEVGQEAFFNITNLTGVYVPWIDAPIALTHEDESVKTFSYAADQTLWIPGGTLEKYQAADGWKRFQNFDFWSFVVNASVTGKGTLAVANGEEVTDNGTNTAKSVTGENLVEAGATAPVSGLFVREKDVTFTTTPARGYELSALTANDADIKEASKVTNLLADQTINAAFTPIIYNITYNNLQNGVVDPANPATYTVEDAAITLVNPTRTGYNFKGWTGTDLEGAVMTVTIPASSIGDREFTATWEPIVYDITYDLAGGAVDPANKDKYTIETADFTLTNPTKTGYTFTGWTGTDLTGKTMTVTITTGHWGNRSYTATWEPNPYKVHFEANGGDGGTMTDQNFVYDTAQNLTENAFTRTGYIFTGWNSKADGTGTPYADKQEVENLTATRDAVVTMYAQWTPIIYYVAFDKNGGTGTDMMVQKFIYDTAQELFENAYTRKGYNFDGWNSKANGSGTPYTDKQSVKNLSVTQDDMVTLYAQWQIITYTISYDLAGGSVTPANPESYTVETETFTLTNPTRKGYEFLGWTGTGLTEPTKNVTIAKGSIDNRSYTANWQIINYTIAYDLAGGEVATANPENYTVETATFTLTNPTREGYTFKGWTGTGLDGATMTVTIAKGSTGNRSYTATWERNTITLVDNADNSDLLEEWDGVVADVTLSGRTFTKNNQWNTICLPFDLTIAGSVLDGAEVRTLSSTSIAGQNLTMSFSEPVTEMVAGKPYVIRWTSGSALVDPKFEGVTVKNEKNSVMTGDVEFIGVFAPTALVKDDVTNLYLGSNNTLYYPNVDGFKVNAFRGYFKVSDSTAAMGFNVIADFGSGSTTRIQNAENAESELDSWYTLNGVKLDGKPTQKGVFIHNGTKVVIK